MNHTVELNDKINTRKIHISEYEQTNKDYEIRHGKLIEKSKGKGTIDFTHEEKRILDPYLINLKNLANAED